MRHVLAVIATLGVGLLQSQTTLAQDAPRPIGTIPLEKVLTQLDRNGNGCVDLEEGRNYVSRRFHAMDRNDDNTLDAAEAPPGAGETTNDRPIPIQQWQDAYHARFEGFDANHDRCLSQDEIAAGRAASAGGTNDGR
ncbi:MAG: hypothetical protein WAZ48_07290 [Lysobacteraceae bacterium]